LSITIPVTILIHHQEEYDPLMWENKMDYGHGTGHGVGYFEEVHEGPCGISKHNQTEFEPGMIVSNEPGYYKEGNFEIRI
jgi:Xaa-Pro aminopeptidase